MKKFLFFIFIIIPVLVKAQGTMQSLPLVDGKVVYESINNVPGKNKDFIFTAANKWMLDSFQTPAGGIESEDKDQGQLLGKGYFDFVSNGTLLIPLSNDRYFFKIQIDCKDGKYRIRLYDVFLGSSDGKYLINIEYNNDSYQKSKNKTVQQNVFNLNAQFIAVMISLQTAVNKAVSDADF